MARNKHPEETVEKILSVSHKLFMEKGYEHTTIQDIVAAVGMSKGAVYHHFKSKEDIYDHIADRYYARHDWMRDPSTFPGNNALEKLRGLFAFLLSDPEKLELDKLGTNDMAVVSTNPRMVWLALESSVRDAAPLVEELILEGNADGSLHVAQPKETAEAFMVLMNIWVGVFIGDKKDFQSKISFLKLMTDALGLPIIDDKLVAVTNSYYDQIMSVFAPDAP